MADSLGTRGQLWPIRGGGDEGRGMYLSIAGAVDRRAVRVAIASAESVSGRDRGRPARPGSRSRWPPRRRAGRPRPGASPRRGGGVSMTDADHKNSSIAGIVLGCGLPIRYDDMGVCVPLPFLWRNPPEKGGMFPKTLRGLVRGRCIDRPLFGGACRSCHRMGAGSRRMPRRWGRGLEPTEKDSDVTWVPSCLIDPDRRIMPDTATGEAARAPAFGRLAMSGRDVPSVLGR